MWFFSCSANFRIEDKEPLGEPQLFFRVGPPREGGPAVFLEEPLPLPALGQWRQLSQRWERKFSRRRQPETLPTISPHRKRKLSEKEQPVETKKLCSDISYMPHFVLCHFSNIPVVHASPEVVQFYPSQIVDQLRQAGIRLIAAEMARQSLPLAGRLSFFMGSA